jgi:hypothetical protein
LAQHIIQRAKDRMLDCASLAFDYSAWPAKAISIEPLVGRSGILAARCLSFSGFDAQDHMLFAAITDEGELIEEDVVRRLFEMPCSVRGDPGPIERARLEDALAARGQAVTDALKRQNAEWFSAESQKLERWADDKVFAAEKELKDAKARILELKREARTAESPEDQHRIQMQIQDLEKSKRRLRQRIFEVEDEIIDERDQMISDLEARLQQDISKQELFAVRWAVV